MNTERCTATRHGTWTAYKYAHCRCPEITVRVRRSRAWHGADRRAVRSSVTPLRGPRDNEPDTVAVLRVIGGERLPLTTADRNAAIDELDRQGFSSAEIARQVGCHQRTVTRRRTQRANLQHAA